VYRIHIADHLTIAPHLRIFTRLFMFPRVNAYLNICAQLTEQMNLNLTLLYRHSQRAAYGAILKFLAIISSLQKIIMPNTHIEDRDWSYLKDISQSNWSHKLSEQENPPTDHLITKRSLIYWISALSEAFLKTTATIYVYIYVYVHIYIYIHTYNLYIIIYIYI